MEIELWATGAVNDCARSAQLFLHNGQLFLVSVRLLTYSFSLSRPLSLSLSLSLSLYISVFAFICGRIGCNSSGSSNGSSIGSKSEIRLFLLHMTPSKNTLNCFNAKSYAPAWLNTLPICMCAVMVYKKCDLSENDEK